MKTDMIEVFVVDDSAIVRTTISSLLQDESDISIKGVASDPLIAHAKFERFGWPDVIILDIEMPRMDGLSFLKQIMQERPTPVIICSSVAQKGSHNAIEALSLGAVEVIAKPEVGLKHFLEESYFRLVHAIKAAYESKKNLKVEKKHLSYDTVQTATKITYTQKHKKALHSTIIVIGSSTGGVQTLEKILPSLPLSTPPILIVQHMPAGFTLSLAQRLDRISHMYIKEAQAGDVLQTGHVYIAPGDKHLVVKHAMFDYVIEIKEGPKVSHHKPSIDVLFNSIASEVGSNALGFILTGMGDDGVKGLKQMKEMGARTYAQEKESCIVYGMPKVAVQMDAVAGSLTPFEITQMIKKESM